MTRRILLLAGLLLALPSATLAQPSLIGTVGVDGKTTATSATNPLPVTGTVTTADQKGAGAVTATTLRTVTATDSPDVTSLGTVAGAVSGARVQVSPVVGQAGVAAGVGASGATTLRTVTATDSPDVTSLGTLDDVVGATSAAAPTSAALVGAVDSTSGAMMPLRIYDGDTGAGNDYRLGVVPLLPGAGGATPAAAGTGVVGSGVLRVVEASRPDALEACSTATVGDAGNAHVIAARAGRRLIWVQVQGDADGQLRVTRAATTGATCTTTGGPGALLDAGTATTAGGYWEDAVGYSGDVAVCVPTAGATVSYCYGEVY